MTKEEREQRISELEWVRKNLQVIVYADRHTLADREKELRDGSREPSI